MARASSPSKPAEKSAEKSAEKRTDKPATKWGDREGRRRDILDAARTWLEAEGYGGLNMRDVASAAGVSPGTLYSYFRTKEEIFATLYAEELGRYADRVEPVCETATDLEGLIVEVTTSYLAMYASYGRYISMWSLLQDPTTVDAFPDELRRDLGAAATRVGAVVARGLRHAAKAQGGALDDDPLALPFFFAAVNGICDQFTSERHLLHAGGWDEFVRYSARALATGLRESS